MPLTLGPALLLAGAITASAGGLKEGSAPAQASSARRFVPIKIILFTRSTELEIDQLGLVTPRRAGLEPSQLEDIQAAIRDFSAQMKQASGGLLEPRISVEEDTEQVSSITFSDQPSEGEASLAVGRKEEAKGRWASFLQTSVGPRINSAPFEANDRIYRGPFEAVFVIHAGLKSQDGDFTLEGKPGRIIGWHTFTQEEPKAALTRELLWTTSRLTKAFSLPQVMPSLFQYPSAYGEVEMSQSDQGIRLVSTGIVARGGARLSLVNRDAPFLSFRARSSTREPMGLNLLGPEGPVASILLKGSIPGQEQKLLVPVDASGNRVEAGDGWTTYSLDLRQVKGWDRAAEIHIGTPLAVDRFEKGPPEHSVLEVADFNLTSTAPDQTLTLKNPAPGEEALRTLIATLRGSEPLSAETLAQAQALAESGTSRERLSVLAAFLVRKDVRAVPMLLSYATGASIAESFLAARALQAQGSPEARAALSEALKKGPFETNRRFVAEVLTQPTSSDLPFLNMMMLQRGWRGRLAAVEAIRQTDSREAQVILTTSLAHEGEPSPQVRLAIASSLDPTFELASRRLLISGVNDPSNWVRAEALVRLLESPFEAIRSEAIRGVRDDAAPVRLALLRAMASKPSPAFRTALRSAVTDSEAEVRAAALDALGAQEGPVQSQEIENTFSDSSREVQLSLIRLAKSGKISLPARVVDFLKASTHQDVKAAAESLGASR